MFADDVGLLTESRRDLQKLLDVVFEYSERWRFRWNVGKSKVMRFGPYKNSKKTRKEHYFLGLDKLEVVKSFKYLGVQLQQNLSWVGTKWNCTLKARSRVPLVTKCVLEGLSVKTGEKIWMTMVRPTLEYAMEICGEGNWPQAEQIQQVVGRTLLGLSSKAAGEVARGELGWISMKARRDLKQLKYWGRLLNMDKSRLVRQIYAWCKDATVGLKGSFCYSIHKTLFDLNLGHLWRSELVGDYHDWVKLAGAAVKKKDMDLWLLSLQKKPKLRVYRTLKYELDQEEYLSWSIPAAHRVAYARIRSGTHQLRIEVGRWSKEAVADRKCNVCLTGKVEDEAHLLLHCYVYERLRDRMLRRIKTSTGYDLVTMKDQEQWLLETLLGEGLASKEVRKIVGAAVAIFLVDALRLRERLLKAN